MNVFDRIREFGIIPVIKIPSVEHAVPLAETLKKAGLPLIEVTLRNDCALDCIAAIKKEVPDMLVAAGTVLQAEQVARAKEAGAELCVAPGLNENIAHECRRLDIPYLPGCVTATEIEKGLELGLTTFKFFPAELMGGIGTIRQLSGPYSGISFIPTSGMNFDNIGTYLSNTKVAAVGGSFMAPADRVLARDWDGIYELCRKAVSISLNFQLVHVGINAGEEGEALARELGEMFGIGTKAGRRSDFAGDMFECCKEKFPGENGHIAVGVRNVERGVAYLRRKGYAVRDEFKGYDNDGNLKSVYLEKEFGGFAIHLLLRK